MRKRIALAILLLLATTPTLPSCEGDSPTSGCCKTCTTGKACGDTCIDASATCNVAPGCACSG
jgi:hypothetical protein